MAEETYINGLFIKKKRFENGGNVINISINSTTFIEELLKYKNIPKLDKGDLRHRKTKRGIWYRHVANTCRTHHHDRKKHGCY